MNFGLNKLIVFSLFLCLLGCGGGGKFVAPDRPPDDRQPVPQPRERKISLAADNVNKIGTERIKGLFDLSKHFRGLSGNPKQAFNVDAFGEVYDSSWFTNRNAIHRLSLEEIAYGPNTGDGPDTSGVWTIFRAKAEGVTPGFSIEDSRGEKYVLKFDPIGFPEMATGAEVVSTKLFYAAGYNVPENYITYFNPKILQLGKEVKFTDKKGNKRFMNQEDLEEVLERIQKRPDGLIRAIASKYLSGSPLGPFRYMGVRKDDANDVIPHEHRRELRGLKVMAAWLNHYDTKANNSLDMFVEGGYVKHYLIDFGSTLGSQGDEPMPPEIGREGPGQPTQVLKTIGSLGIYRRPWEIEPEIKYPSIGNFSSKNFKPKSYLYILPNPAFANATNLDEYWGAKLVISFTDDQIKAAVAEGQYSNPEAAEYLVKTLIARRDIVGRTWFSKMNTLDKFELREAADGRQNLCFVDLAVETGLESADEVEYRYDLWHDGKILLKFQSLGNQKCINLTDLQLSPKFSNGHASNHIQCEIKLQFKRKQEQEWSKWVKVYFVKDSDSGKFELLGARREE